MSIADLFSGVAMRMCLASLRPSVLSSPPFHWAIASIRLHRIPLRGHVNFPRFGSSRLCFSFYHPVPFIRASIHVPILLDSPVCPVVVLYWCHSLILHQSIRVPKRVVAAVITESRPIPGPMQ